ncbi:uncharacterized protein LOC107483039 [Arachis duranensis]|uniref:Uncharacterized protein LOC107483039 n=1 Tax=Arachis duranensis TaxID=130453 RepID=A0A6P4D0B2_ARADU|nr:uncharacterized protein LOC107483039 [Arachis duranensis]
MYVMLDKEKKSWIVSILELRHSNPCSAKKAIHYREYQELTMHAKSIITDNDEAGIRPNKTHGLPFASFVGVNHHGKSTLLGCALLGSEDIPSFEWEGLTGYCPPTMHLAHNEEVIIQARRTTMRIDGSGFQYSSRVNFGPCKKFGSTGLLCCHTLPVWSYYKVDIVPSCYVLPRWSKNVIRKHTYVKSSHDVAQTNESHNLFRDLCSEFYNIAQEFIGCDEEVAILQSAIWDAKSKLNDYCASMRSTTLAATQNTMATQGTSDAIEHDIQGPLRVKTKGRLKTKRLGAELDKLIKKAMQKKKRKSHLDVVDLQTDNEHHGLVNEIFKDSTT